MDNEPMMPVSKLKELAVAIASNALKDVIKDIIVKWWQIGFLCGLTVGWIVGGLVTLLTGS